MIKARETGVQVTQEYDLERDIFGGPKNMVDRHYIF